MIKKNKLFFAALALMVFFTLSLSGAWAAPTTSGQAVTLVTNWLALSQEHLGAEMGSQIKNVETFADDKGSALYYVVYIEPKGFAIVPADDLVEPIVAFLPNGTVYDPSPENPLGALVSSDIPGRILAVRTPNKTLDSLTIESRMKWADILNYVPGTDFGLTSISDVRVAPLVQSKWSQSTESGMLCYNYYTPGPNYVCGCVATAMAQLMRFHSHPTTGVGTGSFTVTVDGTPQTANLRGGDGSGGAYSWANMVLDPDGSITLAQRQAIGSLTYDAGVSVEMQYGASGSGAFTMDSADAFVNTFGYTNAIKGYNSGSSITLAALYNMSNTNLDAGYPVLYGITGDGGHAIVGDGYGYDTSTMYHHLNMGWAGSDDAWYNLPTIGTTYYNFNSVYKCVYNVYKTGSGEILSGRVTDGSGNPISGATVSTTGAGTYSTSTNANGIYAFAKIPAGTYTVSASATGYTFSPRSETLGTSTNLTTVGNIWGADFSGDSVSSELQFSVSDYTVSEDGVNALITVTRTVDGTGAASVTYDTADGSAVAGSDYTDVTGTLSWADGDMTSKTFSVPILNDSEFEGEYETVTLGLSSPIGATLGTQSTAELRITDDVSEYFTEVFYEGGDFSRKAPKDKKTDGKKLDTSLETGTIDNVDIEYQTIFFVPDGSETFYSTCIIPSHAFPVDPVNSEVLSISNSDDDYEEITLSGDAHVSIYGVDYSTIYVNSNGSITFDDSSNTYGNIDAHFNYVQVSGWLTDLNPEYTIGGAGVISWEQLSDSVIVTFDDVAEYDAAGDEDESLISFQIRLFFNGNISITYLGVGVNGPLTQEANIGLSPGYYPYGFEENESDFSEYSTCPPSDIRVEPGILEPVYLEPGYSMSKVITIHNDGGEELTASLTISSLSSVETIEKPALIPGTPTEAAANSTGSGKPAVPSEKLDVDLGPKFTESLSNLSVLFLTALNGADTQFIAGLQSLGNIGTLDIVDGMSSTPNLAYLLGYDAVIVASDYSWADPLLLGNNLADYVDAGGKVILMMATMGQGGNWALDGRIMNLEYSPIPVAPYSNSSATAVSFEDHPITNGVSSLPTTQYTFATTPQGAGQPLGYFSTGDLIGAYNPDNQVVAIQVRAVDGGWGGDLIQMIGNTLEWFSNGWLTVDQASVVIPAGGSVDVTVDYDAGGLSEGYYTGRIVITSDQPALPTNVPAFLGVLTFVDMDNDGLSDGWEMHYFGDIYSQDGTGDPDGDGLTNADEQDWETDPTNPDTDGDGMEDGWEVANGLDPLVADYNDDLDGDGYTNGEENFYGSDPSDMYSLPQKISANMDSDADMELVAGFGTGGPNGSGPGLYYWDQTGGWNFIMPLIPEGFVAHGNSGLIVDFGAAYGTYWYNNSTNYWNYLSPADPGEMVSANMDPDADMEVVVAFTDGPDTDGDGTGEGLGLYYWDQTGGWNFIMPLVPEGMIALGEIGLAVDFGSAFGTYWYNSSTNYWNYLSPADPGEMVSANMDSDADMEFVAAYADGPDADGDGTPDGLGLFYWDNTDGWNFIMPLLPEAMKALGNTGLGVDFGSVYGTYWYDNSANFWNNLSGADPESMVSANMDSDPDLELVASYLDSGPDADGDGNGEGLGLYYWDNTGGWNYIMPLTPKDMIPLGETDGLGVEFGSPYWLFWYDNVSNYWNPLIPGDSIDRFLK